MRDYRAASAEAGGPVPMDAPAPAAPSQAARAPAAEGAFADRVPGISSAEAGEPAGGDVPQPVGAPVKPGAAGQRPAPGAHGAKQADADAPKASEQARGIAQMLIYTAQLALLVDQAAFATTIDQVVDAALGLGGYLASHDNASVQVRVPSARFREALKHMEKLGTVTARSVQVQDVSEEFNDLEVRLKSLRATRDRLEQFLARAKDIQEVLSVERELSRLNGEIDRIEGRMRFLSSRAAFSTITVSLQPKPKTVVAGPQDEGPPPPPRTIPLPIPWLDAVGLDRLLQLTY